MSRRLNVLKPKNVPLSFSRTDPASWLPPLSESTVLFWSSDFLDAFSIAKRHSSLKNSFATNADTKNKKKIQRNGMSPVKMPLICQENHEFQSP